MRAGRGSAQGPPGQAQPGSAPPAWPASPRGALASGVGTAWSFSYRHTAIQEPKRKRCLSAPFWWRWGELNPRPKVPTAGLYARSPRFGCPPGLAHGRAARGEPPCASPGVRGRGPRLAGFVSPLPVSPRQGYRARSRSLSRETVSRLVGLCGFAGFYGHALLGVPTRPPAPRRATLPSTTPVETVHPHVPWPDSDRQP